MNKLQFSPYVCPKCQSMAMNFEIENGVEICGLCETPLIRYSAIPSTDLAALREVAQAALKWRGQWPDEEDIREAKEESCSCAICQLILACDAMNGEAEREQNERTY